MVNDLTNENELKTFFQLTNRLIAEGWETKKREYLNDNLFVVEKIIEGNFRAVIEPCSMHFVTLYIEDDEICHYENGTRLISESVLEEINDIVRRYEAHFKGEGDMKIIDGEEIEIICSSGNHYLDFNPCSVDNVVSILIKRIEKLGRLEEFKKFYEKHPLQFMNDLILPFVKTHTVHGSKYVARVLGDKIVELFSSAENS